MGSSIKDLRKSWLTFNRNPLKNDIIIGFESWHAPTVLIHWTEATRADVVRSGVGSVKLRILPFSSCWILVLFSFSSIWLNPVDSSPSIKLFPGVVIETVAKNSVAERAGIQPGDVLLNWVREDAKGQLESPFDLSLWEVEEAPLGSVTVEGLRNAERRKWILGPDAWGLHTRPNLQGAILDSYQEGKALSVAGRFNEAAEHWLQLAVEAGTSNAAQNHSLAFWLRFHVAEMLGNERLYAAI